MTFWFPVAPGITTLPVAPAVVGGQMTVAAVVPVFNETVKIDAIAHPRIQVYSADYALQLTTVAPVLVYKTKFTYRQIKALLDASPGSYALNQSIQSTLKYTKYLALSVGSFSAQGQDASWFQNQVLAGDPGAFVVTPKDALIVKQFALTAEPSAFTLQEQDASFRVPIKLPSEVGTFNLNGEAALFLTLTPSRVMPAELGTLAISGQNSEFIYATSAGDEYFSSVNLLLHFNDQDGSNTFADSSNNALSLASVNNASTTTSLSKFGAGCLDLSTSANRYLSYPSASGNALDVLANQNLTVEFWAYFTAVEAGSSLTSSNTIFELSGAAQFSIHVNTNIGGNPSLAWSSGYGNTTFYHQNNFTLNTWHHISMVRDGNIWSLYLNGIKSTSSNTNNGAADNSNFVIIGPRQNTTRLYLDEFRMTIGFARYFENFTLQTQPFLNNVPVGVDPYWIGTALLLHCDSPLGGPVFDDSSKSNMPYSRINDPYIDNGTKLFGAGSIWNDGAGDAVTFKDSNSWHFADRNFTIELFFRTLRNTAEIVFVSQMTGLTSQSSFELGWLASTQSFVFRYSVNGTATVIALSAYAPINLNQWYHLAATRQGEFLRLFLDGTQIGVVSIGTVSFFNSSNALQIGGRGATAQRSFYGWIDEARITNGFARYIGNFTVPTAAFYDQGALASGVTGTAVRSQTAAFTSFFFDMPRFNAGELLVAIIGSEKNPSTVPSGWTLYGTYLTSMNLSSRVNVYTKIADTVENTPFWNFSAPAIFVSGLIASVRNAQINTVTEAYDVNGIVSKDGSLNLICTYWNYALGTTGDIYSTSISNGFIGEITNSPAAYSRMAGGHTKYGGIVKTAVTASGNTGNNIGMINIQFNN